jgi:excisionase family DNA binding protein
MTLTLDREPIAARHGDRDALRAVEALTESAADVQLTGDCTTIELPDALRVVLELASRELARGNRVSLLPVERMLTTREAAELLNVSRPYLIRLLEAGRIPYEMVGTHRRISIEDVLRFRAERSADRRRVLRDLSQEADELGIYEE